MVSSAVPRVFSHCLPTKLAAVTTFLIPLHHSILIKYRKTQLQLTKNSGPNFESLDDISSSLSAEPSGRMEPAIPFAVVLYVPEGLEGAGTSS